MEKTYRGQKFRLYPTSEQKAEIEKTFGGTRFVWNYFLERTEKALERRGEALSTYECNRILTKMRKEWFPWLDEIGITALQKAIANLFAARRFAKRQQRDPHALFRSKKSPRQDFTTAKSIHVTESYVQIPCIGRVRCRKRPVLPGNPVEVKISKTAAGKYYASVVFVSEQAPRSMPNSVVSGEIGLALSYSGFVVDTAGNQYVRQGAKKENQRLIRKTRTLRRKKPGSIRAQKTWRELVRLRERIYYRNKEFHHKLTKKIADENQVIAIDHPAVANLPDAQEYKRTLQTFSWTDFFVTLRRKAQERGRLFFSVERRIPGLCFCPKCSEAFLMQPPFLPEQRRCLFCGAVYEDSFAAASNALEEARERLRFAR